MKNFILKNSKLILSLSLLVTTFNVNAACTWLIHQPKLPEGSKSLRKF